MICHVRQGLLGLLTLVFVFEIEADSSSSISEGNRRFLVKRDIFSYFSSSVIPKVKLTEVQNSSIEDNRSHRDDAVTSRDLAEYEEGLEYGTTDVAGGSTEGASKANDGETNDDRLGNNNNNNRLGAAGIQAKNESDASDPVKPMSNQDDDDNSKGSNLEDGNITDPNLVGKSKEVGLESGREEVHVDLNGDVKKSKLAKEVGLEPDRIEFQVDVGGDVEMLFPVNSPKLSDFLIDKGNPRKDWYFNGNCHPDAPRCLAWRISRTNNSIKIQISKVSLEDAGTFFLHNPTKSFGKIFVLTVHYETFNSTGTEIPTNASVPTIATVPIIASTRGNVSDAATPTHSSISTEPNAESDGVKVEEFYDYHTLEEQGLPRRVVIGARPGFTLTCQKDTIMPIVHPNDADFIKLTAVAVHNYVVDFATNFEKAPAPVHNVSVQCVIETKTPEYHHRNISVWRFSVVYAPVIAKVEMDVNVVDRPSGCGSRRVECLVLANPPANFTLYRVIYGEDEGKRVVKEREMIEIPDKCVVHNRETSASTFFTSLSGHFLCVAENQFGEAQVRIYIPHADNTVVVVVVVVVLVIAFAVMLQRYFIRIREARKREQRQSETEGQYHLEETPKDRSGATKLAVTDEDVAGTNL